MDFDNHSEMVKIIKDFNPDIIGISVMTFYKDFVHRAIEFIRDAGIKIPIFLGGPYTTGDYQNALQDENIDLQEENKDLIELFFFREFSIRLDVPTGTVDLETITVYPFILFDISFET